MELIEVIRENWIVLLIPVISAFIGWFTNVVAIKMMFYPTEFVGIPPFLGWQGIVPANAARLAKYSTRLITTKLLSLDQIFSDFDAESFGGENLDPVVDQITEQVIDEVATKRAPMMWENAGEVMQNQVRDMIRKEVRATAIEIAREFGDNINDILDLEEVVIDTTMKNRELMSRMFLEVGSAEFKFIERSGIWFGLFFGIVQMVVWVVWPAWWTLPFAGFFVGYATNWLAIKLIFQPQKPRRFGPFVIQGLFHKRQNEVADAFARLVSSRVLNADNITNVVIRGETGVRLFEIVEKHVNGLIDKYLAHPMAAMVVPEDDRPAIRAEILERIKEELPREGGLLHVFAGRAVDIETNLRERMAALDSESFEGVLRPAFQQDEWKLILAGAVLGFGAGVMQIVYLFGELLDELTNQ